MTETTPSESDFVRKLTAIVEENIAHEQFGVSELADKMYMSRSNLLRKVKKETNLSVSQLINQVRLRRGMELLQTAKLNVSEVSHQVGFSSTSYFIKCFREYYGYPPGEVGKRDQKQEPIPGNLPASNTNRKRNFIILASACLIIALVAVLFFYKKLPTPQTPQVEKSIAVLPFKNDSNDSSNLYLINGLMESTLINLQQIKDLRVLSRTSTEKYRNTARSIREMANELNVVYFIEGSGQKIGDQIVLNIQLIDGPNDNHLWAKQYRRETKDIFALQQEIAKDVAEEIQAIITPEEVERLEKIPTKNMEAYDFFLKGRELLSYRTNLESAVEFFNKAIELDNQFAMAYADAAIAYYYIDIFKADKKYTAEIGGYSDKALLYDPKNAESLMAKAVYYMQRKEHELAIPYLERGLEYNPNSSEIIAVLADLYGGYVPNTTKHLEYALKGLRLTIGSTDSTTTSYTYLRLSNALAQSGFTDEALKYIDKSLAYFPDNPFSRHLRAFILYAKNGDLQQTRELLIKEFNKDSTRFDILQDIGKVSYYLGDIEGAYQYYKEFVNIREHQNLDVYVHENLLIGEVYSKAGQKEKAEEFIESYKHYIDNEKSIYKSLGLASYYIYRHDTKKVVEYMKLAAKEENYMYWLVLFCDIDPQLGGSASDIPEVKQAMEEIKKKFWANHNKIKSTLEEKGLLVEK